MADPMENVLSCAAVRAVAPGDHRPQSWCIRCEVWRLKICLEMFEDPSSWWFIVTPPPLSSVLTQPDPPKLIIQTQFQNTEKWKLSLHCLNTSSCARLSGHKWTVSDEHGSRRLDIFCRGAVNICYHYSCTPFIYTCTATYLLSLLLFIFLGLWPIFWSYHHLIIL